MIRKMIGVASAYLSGLFFAAFFMDKYGFVMLLSAVLILYAIKIKRNLSRTDIYIIVFSFLTAVTVSLKYTLDCYYGVIDFAEQKGSFSGEVVDYEIYDGDLASYTIKGKINNYKNAKIILYSNELGADYGDTISINDCIFQEITGDYLFDTESYKSNHIFLRVYESGNIDVKYNNKKKLQKAIHMFREKMISKILYSVGRKTGGFLVGMLFGERKYLDDSVKISLYRTGTGHILAVSGLHFSVIASIIMFIMKKLKINKFVRFALINLIFVFMIIITNYPLSAIRAVIMLDIVYFAPLIYRQNDTLNSIAVTVMILSIANPYIVYSSGFMLSICGTFGVSVFSDFMAEKTDHKIISAFTTTLCTSVVVMPVSIYYFDETSIISSFTNVFLIPFCTFSIFMCMIFIATGGIFVFPLYIADIAVKFVINISEKIAGLNFTSIPHTENIFATMFIVSGILVVCLYIVTGSRRVVAVSIAVSMMLCVSGINIYEKFRDDRMIVAMLGKNNNSVVVISHKGNTNIIDMSGHYRSAEYVRKYMIQNGKNKINMLLLTQKTASQESTYRHETEIFNVNEMFAINDRQIYNNRLRTINKSGFFCDFGDYIIKYQNKTLTIYYGNSELNISPAKNNIYNNGLNIYYGNITKHTQIYDNSIFLNDMNNFEITMSRDKTYKVNNLINN